jgi:hypothetical protein
MPGDPLMNAPTHWYYHAGGRGFGPLKEADIRVLLAQNEIAADTLVWRDGLSNWTEARSTELGGPPTVAAVSSSIPSIVRLGRKQRDKTFWAASAETFVFLSAELFNCVVFSAIPLFVVLVLSR